MKPTAVLISGGVDSAVAVDRLVNLGLDLHLFYIRIGMDGDGGDCSAEEDIEMCTLIARRYGLPFDVVTLHNEYWENVMEYALDAVRKGLTPNPDMMCNLIIKFGYFERRWGHEFEKTATGHYATTIIGDDGLIYLGTAVDPVKDQTDFLARITYEQLSHVIFPIGDLPKSVVREIAVKCALPNAFRRDSQGICFLGKINYNDFLRRHLGEKPGPIVEIETGRKLGMHHGFWFHTIGQRKGLGIGGRKESLFILATDTVQNVIYVGEGDSHPGLWRQALHIAPREIHWVNPARTMPAGQSARFSVRIRYRQPLQEATLFVRDQGAYILFDTPQRGITPGQFAAWYDGDELVGSGVISE